MEKEVALLEAIFYLESEPLSLDSLCKISGLGRDVAETALSQLIEKYESESSGLELLQISGGYVVAPKASLWDFLRDRYGRKNESRLSRAATETLSVIAYKQPVTRAEIESLRGVNVDNMMRLLLERNLIQEVGKKDIPGKPVLYGTTKEFLKYYRLNSIEDLPKLEEKENERFVLAR